MTQPSKRDIEAELEALSRGPTGDYPRATLAHILRHEWEAVDEDRDLYRAKELDEIFYMPGFDLDL